MNLTERKRYRVVHTRKGAFEGIFLRYEQVYEGAPPFPVVAIDTSDGSGSEWLRRAAGVQSTESALNPALIESIEEVKDDGGLAAPQE